MTIKTEPRQFIHESNYGPWIDLTANQDDEGPSSIISDWNPNDTVQVILGDGTHAEGFIFDFDWNSFSLPHGDTIVRFRFWNVHPHYKSASKPKPTNTPLPAVKKDNPLEEHPLFAMF